MGTHKKAFKPHFRSFPRQSLRAPVIYLSTLEGVEESREGLMLNKAPGGIYFEASEYLAPGSRVHFMIQEPEPEKATNPGSTSFYIGTVRWCRETAGSAPRAYGVGVKLLENECEWCGEKVPYEMVRYTENKEVFCQSCLQDLERIHPGKLKAAITNRLLGNVV
jgi:hypothetical protein